MGRDLLCKGNCPVKGPDASSSKIFQDSFIHDKIIANLDKWLLLPLCLNQTQREDFKKAPDFFMGERIWYREHYWDWT